MPKTKIKLIVLDFHGILVKGDYKPVCRMLAKKHKVKWEDIYNVLYKKYFRQAVLGKIPERKVYENTFRDFGWKGESWKKSHEYHKNAMYLNKTVFKYSLALQNRGYILLHLSQNTRDQFNSYIKKFELKKYFSNIVNTIDLNAPKSSKTVVNWICRKYKVKPKEVVFCDDQESNLVEAKKAKMETIFYKNFKQFKDELEAYLK